MNKYIIKLLCKKQRANGESVLCKKYYTEDTPSDETYKAIRFDDLDEAKMCARFIERQRANISKIIILEQTDKGYTEVYNV